MRTFAAFALAAVPVVSADMVLRQIHVVTRQGSPTTVLDGDSNNPVDTLSKAGQDQMENLGSWIRDQFRYDVSWDDDGPLVTGTDGLVDQYLPTRVRIESSEAEANTLSAQYVASGLFPEERVPIFMEAKRNDVTISAAEECPNFARKIDLLYQRETPYWMEMEHSYMDLLEKLADMPVLSGYATTAIDPALRTLYVPLEHAWKVYDMIREARVTCNKEYDTYDVDTCLKLPSPHAAALLTDEEWDDLKKLVQFAEVETKYGNDNDVPFISGNLLRQIADRMLFDEMAKPSDITSKRVYVTSVDYPMMIAIMKAIKVEQSANLEDAVYPGYGSAFVLELYQDTETSKHEVRVLYKASERAAPTVLSLGGVCGGKQTCNMQNFAAQIHKVAFTTKEWCEACDNDISDSCLFYTSLTYQQQLKEEEAKEILILENITDSISEELSEAPKENTIWKIVEKPGCSEDPKAVRDGFLAAFVGGIACGVVLMCMIFIVLRCIQGRDSQSGRSSATPQARKSSPTTPRTRLWSGSPPRNEDLDADCLSITEEDEDHSIEFSDEPASPQRRRSSPQSAIPSKQNFPPEII